jgi:hypothetical protein
LLVVPACFGLKTKQEKKFSWAFTGPIPHLYHLYTASLRQEMCFSVKLSIKEMQIKFFSTLIEIVFFRGFNYFTRHFPKNILVKSGTGFDRQTRGWTTLK